MNLTLTQYYLNLYPLPHPHSILSLPTLTQYYLYLNVYPLPRSLTLIQCYHYLTQYYLLASPSF